MVVWKYQLNSRSMDIIMLPKGSKVICADSQLSYGGTHSEYSQLCLWVQVPDIDAKLEVRRFIVLGTGVEIKSDKLKHISTILVDKGMNVWHVFEVIE